MHMSWKDTFDLNHTILLQDKNYNEWHYWNNDNSGKQTIKFFVIQNFLNKILPATRDAQALQNVSCCNLKLFLVSKIL